MDIVLRESERLNDTIRSFLAYARPQRFAVARLDVRQVVAGRRAPAAQQRRGARHAHASTSTCPPSRSGTRPTRTRSVRSSGTWRPTGCARWRGGGRLLLSVSEQRDAAGRPKSCSPSRTRGAASPPRARRDLPAVPQLVREGHRARPGDRASHRHRLQRHHPGVVDGRRRHDDAGAPAGAARGRRGAGGPACCRCGARSRHDAPARCRPRGRRCRGRRGAAAKPRILVVDDEPSMRDMLRIVLRRDGYDVLRRRERHARRSSVLQRERVDLLLSDIRMPDVSGVDVLRAAKAAQPRHRRVHDDGVRVDRHRGRGDAARRGGLLHQAVQHGRAAAEGAAAPRGVAG